MGGILVGGIYGGTGGDQLAYQRATAGATQTALNDQGVKNAVSGSANTQNLANKQAGFTQSLGDFGQFMQAANPYLSGGSVTASSSGAGSVNPGTWTPAPVSAPQVSIGSAGMLTGGAPATVTAPNPAAADSAAFSQAKDTTGSAANAAIQGLQRAMSARGIAPGSSVEGTGLTDIYQKGLGDLASASRQQAITDTNTANDMAKANLSALTTQRGQDLSAAEAQNNEALQARGQDIGAGEFNQNYNLNATQSKIASLNALSKIFSGLY